MDGEAILAVIDAHGPAQVSEIAELLKDEGVEATNPAITSALRKLESQGKVAHTPRENWRLAGELAREHAAAQQAAQKSAATGVRSRALIYSPEIIREVPRLERNTVLLYVAYESGGFRLRDYLDGHRTEVKSVAGIDRAVFLEAAYTWTEIELSDEDIAAPLTDNEYWERRIAKENKAQAELLKEGKAVVEG
jgi:hypothetical protein